MQKDVIMGQNKENARVGGSDNCKLSSKNLEVHHVSICDLPKEKKKKKIKITEKEKKEEKKNSIQSYHFIIIQ
jgi:hypothetical protein